MNNEKSYLVSSPLSDDIKGLEESYEYGDTIKIKMNPKEIRVLNFDIKRVDWKKILSSSTSK